MDAGRAFSHLAVTHEPSPVCLFRLLPGEDLRAGLTALASEVAPGGAVLLTCVGSLTRATLRLAGADEVAVFEGPLEICGLCGTLSADGPHLHLSVADAHGKMIGGHLMTGSPIHTTAEVAILIPTGIRLGREPDPRSGYRELVLAPR